MKDNFNAALIAKKLIEKKSVTPEDDGCQELIKNELTKYEFTHQDLNIKNVKNLWLRRGKYEPLIVFAGHTDVVPPGNLKEWLTDPFTPFVKNN